jgi:Prolyl oligopeptidase family
MLMRMEFMPGGALETPEFGSIKLAMDSYQQLRNDARYPPILISLGMNDPRVAPWQPARLAAKSIVHGNPALLRVELDNGHGVGQTKRRRPPISCPRRLAANQKKRRMHSAAKAIHKWIGKHSAEPGGGPLNSYRY